MIPSFGFPLGYSRVNGILGFLMGGIALCVYGLTVEPTASFWDCGEFVAVSYKLEVPHPPGAPLYLLIGRIFSMLAGGDVSRVAYWVNMLSVVCSALTISFLFWTLSRLVSALIRRKKKNLSRNDQFVIMGSAVLGALIYTFSDTFWFSAVEAEVYAMSSLFTAIIIWAILKWESIQDPVRQNIWLLFISYMIGLSIGVHLLGLVALPALGIIYYAKRNPQPSVRGLCFALALSLVGIFLITIGIIQGIPTIALSFDVFFVNRLSLPFGSGAISFSLLLLAGLVAGIYLTHRYRLLLWHTVLLSLAFIFIGYSSYLLVLIRSHANPTIDENNPEELVSFLSYLKREQYGDRPLLYGRNFTARLLEQKNGDPIYVKGEDKYEIADYEVEPIYDPSDMTLFPRMYSATNENQSENYRRMSGLKKGEKPNMLHNIVYFFNYQLGHMYFRYLLWNFAGRAHDEQHAGWLSIRDAFKEVPGYIAQNKGRNNYFMLPLLLGILGLVFHAQCHPRHFYFVLSIFAMAGIGIIIYLNMPPSEPRERDYIFSGSFYAFSIWTGLSFAFLHRVLGNYIPRFRVRTGIVSLLCLTAPFLMAKENWDDHDRSGRYFSVDTAINLLESCQPNAILFTGGDNDTFPLWYAQEVEGIRTDVRVIVLSYFNTDWYIDQMKRPAYLSAPVPFDIPLSSYRQGGLNDFLLVNTQTEEDRVIDLQRFIELIAQDDPRLRIRSRQGNSFNSVPSNMFVLKIDSLILSQEGLVPEAFDSLKRDRIYIPIKGNYMEKKDLAILDLMVANNWKRPIYFNHTSLAGLGFILDTHVVQEGMAFRLLPIVDEERLKRRTPLVDVKRSYQVLSQKFQFRGLQDPDIYYSEDYRNFVLNHRAILLTLGKTLVEHKEQEKAKDILFLSLEKMPHEVIPYDHYNSEMVDLFLELNERETAISIAEIVGKQADEKIEYLKQSYPIDVFEFKKNFFVLGELNATFRKYKEDSLAQKYERIMDRHLNP
ncbi:MAG: DUF2723 domain-containing protein [Cytophagales bacterium]|nr:DUF2723 domain-containing protein [Cytophagales bacterium]